MGIQLKSIVDFTEILSILTFYETQFVMEEEKNGLGSTMRFTQSQQVSVCRGAAGWRVVVAAVGEKKDKVASRQ